MTTLDNVRPWFAGHCPHENHSSVFFTLCSLSDSSSLLTFSLCHTRERTHTPERRFFAASVITCVWERERDPGIKVLIPSKAFISDCTHSETYKHFALQFFWHSYTTQSVVFRKRTLSCFLPCKTKCHCVHVFTQNLFNSFLCDSRLNVERSY